MPSNILDESVVVRRMKVERDKDRHEWDINTDLMLLTFIVSGT